MASAMPGPARPAEGFTHLALLYSSTREYLAGVLTQLRTSLRRAEPSFVAVPAPKVDLLRDELNGESAGVLFADMSELGRNPARIIPLLRAFIDDHPGQRVSYVGEPIWPARSAAEMREATRHEALINLAFSGTAATALCPYDTTALAPSVVADARRTHPALLQRGQRRASPEYCGPARLPPECERPLPPPPPGSESITYLSDLSAARGMVISYASHAGATQDTIADPLAGRQRPAPDAPGGHGLWLVNQICDLVELRSGPAGTSIRMHMRRY